MRRLTRLGIEDLAPFDRGIWRGVHLLSSATTPGIATMTKRRWVMKGTCRHTMQRDGILRGIRVGDFVQTQSVCHVGHFVPVEPGTFRHLHRAGFRDGGPCIASFRERPS